MPTGTIDIALSDPKDYKNPFSAHSGNLFQLTDEIDNAQATDSLGEVIGLEITSRTLLQDPKTVNYPAIKIEGSFSRPMAAIGTGYDQRVEIYLDHFYEVDGHQEHLLSAAMILINTITGDFKVIPPMHDPSRALFAKFNVVRIPEGAKNTVDASQLISELGRAFELIADLPKMKFSERDAMALATHKHYKGGLYREVMPIRDADTGDDDRTLYFHLWPKDPGPWHRNTEEYHGLLETGVQRFARLEDDIPLLASAAKVDDLQFEVNLFRCNVDQNGIHLSTQEAIKLVDELNSRPGVYGEYGQPKNIQNLQRALFIEAMNECCQFSNFRVSPVFTERGKQAIVISATVLPSGLMGMQFVDSMRGSGPMGFAMRLVYDEIDGHKIPQKIITFDFEPGKKNK